MGGTTRPAGGPAKLSKVQVIVLTTSLICLIGSLTLAVVQPSWLRFGGPSPSADRLAPLATPSSPPTPSVSSDSSFGSIQGTVVDPAGNPMQGVEVTLLVPGRQQALAPDPYAGSAKPGGAAHLRLQPPPATYGPAGKVMRRVRTSADGTFLLDQLMVGQYWLGVRPPQDAGYAGQIMEADWARNPIGGLYVGSMSRYVIEIPLAKPGVVSGVVLDADGLAATTLVRAELATDIGWIPQSSLRSQGSRGFTFTGLRPGTYRLTSTSSRGGISYYPGVGWEGAAKLIKVAAGRRTAVGAFKQAGPARLAGVVRAADGRPLAGATVRVIDQPDNRPSLWRDDAGATAVPRSTTADRRGRFTLEVPAGEYAVWAPPGDLTVPPGRCRPTVPRQRHVVAIAGATTRVQLHSRTGGMITGRLRAANGTPTTPVEVTLMSQPSPKFRKPCLYRTMTDDRGRYRRSGLADGDYQVWLEPPRTSTYPLVSGRYLTGPVTKRGQRLTVAGGQTVTGVDGRLVEAATLRVHLTTARPAQIADQQLCVFEVRRGKGLSAGPCSGHSTDGWHTVSALHPGVYAAAITAPYGTHGSPNPALRFLDSHGGVTLKKSQALRVRLRDGEDLALQVKVGRQPQP